MHKVTLFTENSISKNCFHKDAPLFVYIEIQAAMFSCYNQYEAMKNHCEAIGNQCETVKNKLPVLSSSVSGFYIN